MDQSLKDLKGTEDRVDSINNNIYILIYEER